VTAADGDEQGRATGLGDVVDVEPETSERADDEFQADVVACRGAVRQGCFPWHMQEQSSHVVFIVVIIISINSRVLPAISAVGRVRHAILLDSELTYVGPG